VVILPSLPNPPRHRLNDGLNRIIDRFGGMIADCMADGSGRLVDQHIAAQMLTVTLNAVAEAPIWVRGVERAEIGALYVKPLLLGVFADSA
jgi:hypothetical protein